MRGLRSTRLRTVWLLPLEQSGKVGRPSPGLLVRPSVPVPIRSIARGLFPINQKLIMQLIH